MQLPPRLCPNVGHTLLMNFIHCHKLECILSCRMELCVSAGKLSQGIMGVLLRQIGDMHSQRDTQRLCRPNQSSSFTQATWLFLAKRCRSATCAILFERYCSVGLDFFLEVQAGAAEQL